MTAAIHPTRRDQRFLLRPGSATVEFAHPTATQIRASGEAIRISVSGLAFETDGSTGEFPAGMQLPGLKLRIGPCLLRGDAVVRYTETIRAGCVEVGCLFYPANAEFEDRLMALVAGAEAALVD